LNDSGRIHLVARLLMDWITRQKIDQLCKENNCIPFYSKGGYSPPVTLIYKRPMNYMAMSNENMLEFELEIYAFDLIKPWKDLEAMITEFATACSIRDCFEDG